MEKRLKLLLAVFALSGVVMIFSTANSREESRDAAAFIPEPMPTPILTSALSPDMKKTLVMKEEKNESSVAHTFSVTNQEDNKQIEIFSKSLNPAVKFTIPMNTWSPDNKFVFLRQTGNSGAGHVVLSATDAALHEGLEDSTIESLFAEKYNNYKVTDVTGWAAPSLIIVNTDNLEGELGPSFWFNVNSLMFTQLSSRFN